VAERPKSGAWTQARHAGRPEGPAATGWRQLSLAQPGTRIAASPAAACGYEQHAS
jgi:hypothetical protein